MATSGNIGWTITRNDIISAALKKLGAYDASDAIPADELEDAAFALNACVKELMVEGEIGLWLRETITLFLQPDQKSYDIGSTSTDHATLSYTETALAADASSGASSITVDSATGLVVGYYIGIILDDESIHWTTISSIASTTIGLTVALTDDASADTPVYAYQTKANRFQRPIDAYRRYSGGTDEGNIDTTVDVVARMDYDALSQKVVSGPPTMVSYQPNLTNGLLYVWPTNPAPSTYKLILVVESTVESFDAASNNPEFPQEWGNVLIWMLAADLAADYGLPLQDRGWLRNEAERKKEKALQYSQDTGPVRFAYDNQGG